MSRVAGVLEGSTSGHIAETFKSVLDACRMRQVLGLVRVIFFSDDSKTTSRNSLCTIIYPALFVQMKVAS